MKQNNIQEPKNQAAPAPNIPQPPKSTRPIYVNITELEEGAKFYDVMFNIVFPTSVYQILPLLDLLDSINKHDTIRINLNTPGGSVPGLSMILNAIKRCRGKVITKPLGMAASCGSILAFAGDEVEINPYSVIMFHNISAMFFDNLAAIEEDLESLKQMYSDVISGFVEKGILTEDEYTAIAKNKRDIYISGREMIERLNGGPKDAE